MPFFPPAFQRLADGNAGVQGPFLLIRENNFYIHHVTLFILAGRLLHFKKGITIFADALSLSGIYDLCAFVREKW